MPGVKKCEVVSTRDFIIRVTCEPQHHQPHADQVPLLYTNLFIYDQVPSSCLVLYTLSAKIQKKTRAVDGMPQAVLRIRIRIISGNPDPDPHHSKR
jgi:hypothetical protein